VETCKAKVDRREKGLHCSNGGHRICWSCMVKHVDWERLVREEPHLFDLSERSRLPR
jgi:hypothetical protein